MAVRNLAFTALKTEKRIILLLKLSHAIARNVKRAQKLVRWDYHHQCFDRGELLCLCKDCELKNKKMEKIHFSHRACGCWKQAEAVGESIWIEKKTCSQGSALYQHSLLKKGSETGLRDGEKSIIRWHRNFNAHSVTLFCVGIFNKINTGFKKELEGEELQWNESFMEDVLSQSWRICVAWVILRKYPRKGKVTDFSYLIYNKFLN